MSEKRRGLGRGLGALIPTGLETRSGEGARPVDVFFPDRSAERAAEEAERANALTSDDAVTTGQDDDSGPATGTAGTSDARGTATSAARDGAAAATPDGADRGGVGGTADASTPAAARATAAPVVQGSGTSTPVAGSAPDADATPVDDGGLLPVPGASFAELPVESIRPNPRQPRSVFDEDALDELVGSIREIGVLQPVVVRPVDDGYELIMGERRWRATQAAGLTSIPAIVRQTEDADLLRDALLENLHRSQLNPLEEAAAYQQLLDDFGCTHEELASRIHRSRPQISNTLRLLRLPPLVQRRVAAGVLSAGHARALLGLADGAAIERLAQRIVAEGLSVRAVEEIVALGADERRQKRRPRAGVRNEALDELATRLSDRFETRVKVDLGKQRGKLTVEFASVQDLNRILSSLAPEDPGVFRG